MGAAAKHEVGPDLGKRAGRQEVGVLALTLVRAWEFLVLKPCGTTRSIPHESDS